MNILQIILKVLIFPGLLFVILAGQFLAGFDRILVAKMQKRIGPPLIQPWYDFFKLLGKETIIPRSANKVMFLGCPIISIGSLIVMALFIPLFGHMMFSTSGDVIVLIYLLTIPAVSLMLAGSASGSPYAGIGASREMVTMMAYELPLILSILSVCRVVGEGNFVFSISDIVNWQQINGAAFFHWTLIPAAIAFLLVIPAEVGTQPFDVAEAETEICEGPLVEYSGAPLGLFKLSTAIKMFIMTSLFVMLFFGSISTGYIVLDAIIELAICTVVTGLGISLPHAICARLKIEDLFKFYWTIVTILAFTSFILTWYGL